MNKLLSRTTVLMLTLGLGLVFLTGCNKPTGDRVLPKLPVSTVPMSNMQVLPPEPPAETVSTNSQSVVNVSLPVEPSGNAKDILDQTCEKTAGSQEAPGGDFFNSMRFERPFDASMNYLPYLDITRARILRDGNSSWIFVTIYLVKSPADGKDLQPAYGVEIDNNIDGRGELLVWAVMPQGTQWTTSGVQVFEDADHNVGGLRPIKSDGPSTGNGYETLIFGQDAGNEPNAAYVRINPKAASQVQFAFKKDLLGANQGFLWNAWTDAGVKAPASFDYNDMMTMEEAGSPIRGQQYFYPIKNLWGVDNTCRGASNYATNGNELGLCKSAPAPVVDASPVTPTKPGKPDGGSVSGGGSPVLPPTDGGSWEGGGTVVEPPTVVWIEADPIQVDPPPCIDIEQMGNCP